MAKIILSDETRVVIGQNNSVSVRGGSRDSFEGGEEREGGLCYGAIFSIIDGTNCSLKAVLPCRLESLVFISFSA